MKILSIGLEQKYFFTMTVLHIIIVEGVLGMLKINDMDSPFQVGMLVIYENFIGREEILENILKRIASLHTNNQQHFFITGERGIGKTSLTNYVSNIAEKNLII